MMRAAALGLILTAICGGVRAQSTAAPASTVSGVTVTVRRATPVSGVTVTASVCPEPDPARDPADTAPHVVDSYPAKDGVVPPGVAVVRATFDAPMSCYWEVFVQSSLDDDPCEPSASWALPGRTTVTLNCRLAAGARYTVRFGKGPGHGFIGLSGRAAEPYSLSFSTTDAAPVASLEAARRLDPGPPGPAKPTLAYVTCTDLPTQGDDCRRMAATDAATR